MWAGSEVVKGRGLKLRMPMWMEGMMEEKVEDQPDGHVRGLWEETEDIHTQKTLFV